MKTSFAKYLTSYTITKYRKRICILGAVFVAALLTVGVVRARESAYEQKMAQLQDGIAGEVFRFHVLANSDEEKDQALKLKVRDAVIAYMKSEIADSASAEETKRWSREHLQEIEEVSEKVIREEGFSYTVKAEVRWCDFPDKTYGDVFFPAGRYEALRIEIGAAKGHNWWCVLYPNLCFTGAVHAVVPEEGKEQLKTTLDEEEYEMVTEPSRFKIKWFFFG